MPRSAAETRPGVDAGRGCRGGWAKWCARYFVIILWCSGGLLAALKAAVLNVLPITASTASSSPSSGGAGVDPRSACPARCRSRATCR